MTIFIYSILFLKTKQKIYELTYKNSFYFKKRMGRNKKNAELDSRKKGNF